MAPKHPATQASLEKPSIVNPLPVALRHYAQALQEHLGAHADMVTISAEKPTDARPLWRLGATVRLLRLALERRALVIIWPSFGIGELAICRVARGPRLVIIHDPVPLRRQIGYGKVGRILGRWGSTGRQVVVATHTQLAARELDGLGVTCDLVLPHPVMRRPRGPRVTRRRAPTVLVAGQCKTARDLELLQSLPAKLPSHWQLRICGRGWPSLDGWTVDARFLDEAELDSEMLGADAVLLPYSYYFQSGIATRASELGVPVVARRHEFVEQLFGRDWPGLVEDDDLDNWARVLTEVIDAAPEPPTAASEAADREWRTALAMLAPATTATSFPADRARIETSGP